MAVVLKKLWMSYDLISEVLPDPRTKSWLLVVKPHEGLLIVGLYAQFVLNWGPKWMKNRPPYNIDLLLIIYNIIQVVACAYIFYEALAYAWLWDYRWVCEPVDFSNTPKALRVARVTHHYYLTKYLDLLDTVFFILRKKFNQVSFLHVYHHIIMVLITWGGITYFPGGHGTFLGLLNAFVHVVMYGYYLLTIIRPNTKQSVWWKKHLTQLQIVQLALICFHMSLLLVTPNCAFPWWPALLVIPGNFFMLCLFVDFYIKTYIRSKNKTNGFKANGNGTIEQEIKEVKNNNEGNGKCERLESVEESDLRQRHTSM